MKKVAFFVDDFFKKDEIFLEKYNRDHCLDPFIELKKHFKKLNIDIHTQDIIAPDEADLIIVENDKELDVKCLKKSILLITECHHVLPKLSLNIYQTSYLRSYTYQDEFVDNSFFFPLRYCFKFPFSIPRHQSSNKKLACMIAGNKRCNVAGELYSERVKIIEWFEKNACSEFDLYGTGWNHLHKMSTSWIKRKLLYRRPLNRFFISKLQCYKGRINSKSEAIPKYKFSFTLENSKDIPGYITEKIFDAMFLGCVPIYWGAPNVSKYIPDDCYIHYDKFKSIAELYLYLRNMPESEYNQYLDAIDNFIQSSAIEPFTIKTFVNTLSEGVCELLKVPFQEYHE